nr:hypothetical protein [Tanacetum cinerariifolium]
MVFFSCGFYNSDPVPQRQNVSSSTDTTVPSQQELNLLFGPLYDEFFNAGTSSVNKSSSPIDNSNQQDTIPTTNNPSSIEPSNPTINIHAEENNDNHAEDTQVHHDKFINSFCTSIREVAESSSLTIDNLNMHTFNQSQDSEYRWTKDHIFHDTKDNSEKDLILSLQTQLQETAELVVRFADEKYFVSKENESLKDDIKSLQTENNVQKFGESELPEKIDQMKSQVSELSEKLQILNQEMKQQITLFEEDKRMFLAKNEFLEKVSYSVQKEYNDLMASNDVLRQSLETKFNLSKNNKSLEQTIEIIEKEMGDTAKSFDAEKKVFENEISKLEKVLEQRVKYFDEVNTELSKRTDKFETYFANLKKENALLKSQLASQNYTSLQEKNNGLRSYNVLKEEYKISCAKLEKENSDLEMHHKRLFDSIKQKNVASQVFTKSIPKVNVSDKIYTGESSKPISKKISQFTTYYLQKDRKYLKKQHSSETFGFQNHVKNESSKQMWKSKENISKQFKYSRDEMFSMR